MPNTDSDDTTRKPIKSDQLQIEELKKKHSEALDSAEQAIRKKFREYRKLRGIARDIVSNVIDIGEYHHVSTELLSLLELLIQAGGGPLFTYFYESVDPRKSGSPRYLRAVCLDLLQLLDAINKRRMEKRNITLVD